MHAEWRVETLVVDACALIERGDEPALVELAQLRPLLESLADDCRDAEVAGAARAVVADITSLCADHDLPAAPRLAS
jgi:hypothetical protein